MGVAVADGSRTSQEPRSAVHAHCGLEYRSARCSAHDLRLCGLPRSGQCPFAAGGVRRFGGRPATNSAGPGKAFELGYDEFVAAPLATPVLAGGDRLALDTVLWRTAQEPQR